MATVDMRAGGKGRKDRNAAIAAEFFATLDATHGNAAQAKSMNAILKRATERYLATLERKAARKGEPEWADSLREQLAANDDDAPARARAEMDRPIEQGATPANVKPEDWAAVREDAGREDDFVARMRALAAANEAEGVRTG